MRVLIAPDKFKGTLTARQAAAAIAQGWRSARPRDQLTLLPMSDGGDGFGEVLAEVFAANRLRTTTVNAAGLRCVAPWWWNATKRTAVVESARIIGLAMLPPGMFHPFELDTRGLAGVLQAAAKRGARRCWVGIGGSATNDGGFGLARGLGWQFTNKAGRQIVRWTELESLVRIQPPERIIAPEEIIVAVDVQNPLLGPKGCTRVYGPQKGLKHSDFQLAERCLRRLAKVVCDYHGSALDKLNGSGAAGGLGFGLMAFAGARLEPGFELIAETIGLRHHLQRADLVITGEGRLDGSTMMGKGTGELIRQCGQLNKPCIALAGQIAKSAPLRRLVVQMRALTDLAPESQARTNAGAWLRKLSALTARQWPGAESRLADIRPAIIFKP